ncbi:unnamed protein product [Coffea canephora]|uniref:Uncharacterized protein n=1 Tax=Coffea canephora TaxID=49390 RepID=A0A068UHL6_COFCA|nr:unnamed protein product [Coffea canephora]
MFSERELSPKSRGQTETLDLRGRFEQSDIINSDGEIESYRPLVHVPEDENRAVLDWRVKML